MIIPTNINLFGPAHSAACITQKTSAFQFVGDVLSCSTHRMPFSRMAPVESARMLVLWAPRNVANIVRLIACDDGPSNIVEIARIVGNGNMGPTGQACDIAACLNTLIAGGVDKQIGFQIAGDGVNAWTLYEVQLEINYLMP